MIDKLVKTDNVTVIDNLSSDKEEFVNKKTVLVKEDLLNSDKISKHFKNIDMVYHIAANPDVCLGAKDKFLL